MYLLDILETALFVAAFTFVGCAAFWIPLAALIGRPLHHAVQLAAGLAIVAFLAGLVFGPTWQHSDADDYPERCEGRYC